MEPLYAAYVVLRPVEFGVLRPFIELDPMPKNSNQPSFSIRPGCGQYIEDYLDHSSLIEATKEAYDDPAKRVRIQEVPLTIDILEKLGAHKRKSNSSRVPIHAASSR